MRQPMYQEHVLLILLKTVVELAEADAQLGGGGGAVAVVLLQHRQNVIPLDDLQRVPSAGGRVLGGVGGVGGVGGGGGGGIVGRLKLGLRPG